MWWISKGYCVFIDAEHSLDSSLAKAIGVNTENLLLSQPDCGEQALSLVDTLIRSGSVDVVDSVAALVPKTELEGEMGDAHMAMQARLMSQSLRKLSHSLSQSHTILIFINQLEPRQDSWLVQEKNRDDKGIEKGGMDSTILQINISSYREFYGRNGEGMGWGKQEVEIVDYETTGTQVQVKIAKNKLAPPFKTVQFELEFGKGISRESEIIELAVKHKFIKKNVAFYDCNGRKYHGKEALREFLAHNDDVQEELVMKLRGKLLEAETDQELRDETTDGEPTQ